MNAILALAAGGAIGALGRHGLAVAMTRAFGAGFPWGHLLANVLGSVAIGVLMAVFASRGVAHEWRLFLVSGILGAFTTFSAFSYDTLMLVEQGANLRAVMYVAASVLLCLGGAWLGLAAGRAV